MRTREQIKKYQKEWALKNKDHLRIYLHDRYIKKKKEIKEKQKEYRQKNKKKIALMDKLYRENNKEKLKLKGKLYYKNNKERHRELAKEWRAKNKEKKRLMDKLYRENNKEKVFFKKKEYAKKNREYISTWHNLYVKKRKTYDPNFKILLNLRNRLYYAAKGKKSVSITKLIGCDARYLKKHLESQFKKGMSWNNYGYRGWHIDHIKPCDYFDLTILSQQKKCFNYTNLQPMWAIENIKKGNRYAP